MKKRKKQTLGFAMGYVILNSFGDLWSKTIHSSEMNATDHLNHFFGRGRVEWEKFEILQIKVPVRVRLVEVKGKGKRK